MDRTTYIDRDPKLRNLRPEEVHRFRDKRCKCGCGRFVYITNGRGLWHRRACIEEAKQNG